MGNVLGAIVSASELLMVTLGGATTARVTPMDDDSFFAE